MSPGISPIANTIEKEHTMKQILTFALAGLLSSAFAAPDVLADDEDEHFILLEEQNEAPSDVDEDATNDDEKWEEKQEEAIRAEGLKEHYEFYEDVQNQPAQMPEAAADVENDSILTGAQVEEENEGGN